jgi:RimJ/RimL family protein N-acetyltransferase
MLEERMQLRYPIEGLSGDLVQIRPWRSPEDLPCVEAAATDPDITAGTTVPAAFTAASGAEFLERQQARLSRSEGISQAVVDRPSGRAVGLVYLDRRPQPWIAGLGYWLIPAARGRHLGTEAVRLVSDWALRDLDILRLEAWVAPDNQPSQRVLSRAGFVQEGRLRNFLQLHGRTTDGLVFARVPAD